jgi:hypothetical protein
MFNIIPMNPTSAFLTITLILLSTNLFAQQDVIRQAPCENAVIKRQADSLKSALVNDNFELVRDAMFGMESEYEMPVILPMEKGVWYQVIFIGDEKSKLHELRMYDYTEREVAYKKNYGLQGDGSIINFQYIPVSSEFHIIKPLQVNKKQKKNLCGCLILMKKKSPQQ